MAQLVTRVDAPMAAAIDALVESGRYESRSDVVRSAVEVLIDSDRRREIGRAIVDGYERIPETAAELEEARALSTAMIEAEPWD